MKNEQDACDIVQDVFLKLLNHPKKFENEALEKAWILRTAINRCKDQLKSSWRKKRISFDEWQNGLPSFMEANSHLDNDESEQRQIILSSIFELPDIYREVIFLFYYEEYSAEEIAQMLHKNPSTIRSRLQKARELLKKTLREGLL